MSSLVTTVPDSTEFSTMMCIAKAAVASQMYPKSGNESAIFMKLLAAREMRLPFITALNGGIHCFDGKMEISPRLLNGMIRSHGHKIETVRHSNTECVLKGSRSDTQQSEEASFTWQEAEKAGLATKDNWRKYPQDMLYARAMSRLARRLFPDIIGTSYVEGEVIEVAAEAAPSPKRDTLADHPVVGRLDGESPYLTNVPEPTLTGEQAHNLQSRLLLCSSDFQKRFKDIILERFNIADLSLLPVDRYEKMMASIENNIETQKQISEVNNADS